MLLLTTQPIAHQTNIYRMLHAEKSEFQENSACKHAHELALENMLKGTQSSILCAWGRNLWATSFTTTHWWVLDSSLNKKRSREQQDARAPYAGKTPQTVHWWKRLFSFYYSSLCMYIVCMHFGVFFFFGLQQWLVPVQDSVQINNHRTEPRRLQPLSGNAATPFLLFSSFWDFPVRISPRTTVKLKLLNCAHNYTSMALILYRTTIRIRLPWRRICKLICRRIFELFVDVFQRALGLLQGTTSGHVLPSDGLDWIRH